MRERDREILCLCRFLKWQMPLVCSQPMETNGVAATPAFRPRSAKQSLQPLQPETEVYLSLLVVIFLIDNKKYDKVSCPCIVILGDILLYHMGQADTKHLLLTTFFLFPWSLLVLWTQRGVNTERDIFVHVMCGSCALSTCSFGFFFLRQEKFLFRMSIEDYSFTLQWTTANIIGPLPVSKHVLQWTLVRF